MSGIGTQRDRSKNQRAGKLVESPLVPVLPVKSSAHNEVVRTDAGGCGEVSLVAHITVAAEGPDGVDALTVATQIWHHLALVDV